MHKALDTRFRKKDNWHSRKVLGCRRKPGITSVLKRDEIYSIQYVDVLWYTGPDGILGLMGFYDW